MEGLSDPGQLLNQLCEKHWPTISRHAWVQYRRRGRGAIVFSLRYPGEEGKEPLRYLTFDDREEEIQASPMQVLYGLVQEYDPAEEVVVAAELPNRHTVFDVFRRDPAPAETEKEQND